MLGVEFALLLTLGLLLIALLSGYPVGLSLGGAGILGLAFVATLSQIGLFAPDIVPPLELAFQRSIGAVALRLSNGLIGGSTAQIFLAIPLFVLMGAILHQSGVAHRLFDSAQRVLTHLFPNMPGRPAILVILLAVLLSSTTGIVGASVSSLALVAYPALVRNGAPTDLASGLIIAGGTLGQIIPPSIVLVLLSVSINEFYAPLNPGKILEIRSLFWAAIIPGLLLAVFYLFYALWAWPKPSIASRASKPCKPENHATLQDWLILSSPIVLTALVLGSILGGFATLSEGASLGAAGAILLALSIGKLNFSALGLAFKKAVSMWSNIALILIGALVFNLSLKGFGGDLYLQGLISGITDPWYLLLFVLLAFFLLGFFFEFVEMTVLLVPLFAPVLFLSTLDPVWIAVLIALVVQTSFLTPPMGLSLFYFQAAIRHDSTCQDTIGSSLDVRTLYRGVVPFVFIQLLVTLGTLLLFRLLN